MVRRRTRGRMRVSMIDNIKEGMYAEMKSRGPTKRQRTNDDNWSNDYDDDYTN